MLNTQPVQDHFGQYYKIHTLRDKPTPKSLKPETFTSIIPAQQFVDNLVTPTGYWREIYIPQRMLPVNLFKTLISYTMELPNYLKTGKIQEDLSITIANVSD